MAGPVPRRTSTPASPRPSLTADFRHSSLLVDAAPRTKRVSLSIARTSSGAASPFSSSPSSRRLSALSASQASRVALPPISFEQADQRRKQSFLESPLARAQLSTCESASCRAGVEANKACYSPVCRRKHSLWHRRAIRQLLARIQICSALRVQVTSPFVSFVPRALHEYLRDLNVTEAQEEVPYGTAALGAVLFADASGFTALTERLAKSVCHPSPCSISRLTAAQRNGAEELCNILNAFFTILVRTVHKFNGDIIKVCAACSVVGLTVAAVCGRRRVDCVERGCAARQGALAVAGDTAGRRVLD